MYKSGLRRGGNWRWDEQWDLERDPNDMVRRPGLARSGVGRIRRRDVGIRLYYWR